MKYLSMIECPVVFPGENELGLASRDLFPRAGVSRGLISRHVNVLEGRIVAVCIWENEDSCKRFFEPEWYQQAKAIWGEGYQLRLERIDDATAA